MRIEQKTILIMFYLIACELHNAKVDEKVITGINIDLLFDIAKKHSLVAIVYTALEKTKYFKNGNAIVIKEWKELKEKAIKKNIMFGIESKQILSEFLERQIWYILLKGSVLKAYYPKEYMREMADIDILYDKKNQIEVKEIFKSKGYNVFSFAKDSHDVYRKKPIYNYELHTKLFSEKEYPEFYYYFENIQKKNKSDADNIYEKHLSDEDFYIYTIAHSYKHYINAGIGFRFLIDLYVINIKLGKKLDWKYIFEQLHRMKINDYEKSCRNLANHLLNKVLPINLLDLPIDEQIIFNRFCLSGTYGNFDNYLRNNLKKYASDGITFDKQSKIKYYLNRMFPDKDWYKIHYPRFGNFKIMIPFLWVHRLCIMLLFKRKKIKYEIKFVKNATGYFDKKMI